MSTKNLVKEFHDHFYIPTRTDPTLDVPEKYLRYELIREELEELKTALDNNDIVEVADALGDLKYVVEGAALAFGIPLTPVVNVIHRSNMTKLGEDGKPVYRPEDGKVMKGPNYEPPTKYIKHILGISDE